MPSGNHLDFSGLQGGRHRRLNSLHAVQGKKLKFGAHLIRPADTFSPSDAEKGIGYGLAGGLCRQHWPVWWRGQMGGSTAVSESVSVINCCMMRRTSSVRLVTVSFLKSRFKCMWTVCGEILKPLAISTSC